jgi:hypothetical protein
LGSTWDRLVSVLKIGAHLSASRKFYAFLAGLIGRHGPIMPLESNVNIPGKKQIFKISWMQGASLVEGGIIYA